MAKVKDRVGEINYNKFGSKMEIIAYRGANDIDVYFEEYNWVCNNTWNNFKKGGIVCPYERRTCSVGFIGEGKYKPKENNKPTKVYSYWHHMMNRCYLFHEHNITYTDCLVDESWHNLQNYGKWFDDNYYEIEGEKMCLDKDILVKDNKIYSPSTCIFVPERINTLFCKSKKSRGDLPIGVRWNKSKGKFETNISIDNKQTYLGSFNTMEEAFQCYKTFKENYIKQVADDYYSKGLIPKKLYDAMYRYEVEITD